jgi:NADPH:quinone reductase-like Zn-dependent oxidoreductase
VVCFNPILCGECAFCLGGQYEFCLRAAILSEGEFAGTLAEYVQVPRENLVALPDEVSFEDAACLPTAYLTAYRMLFHRAHAQAGDHVLVQGASGGVATAAVLIGKAAGLNIAVTSRTQEKLDLAKELGADTGILLNENATKSVREWSEGRGADVVLETVGEPTWDLSLRAARPGGTIVVAGGTGGYNPPAQLNRIFWRQLTIVGCVMGTLDELRTLVDQVAAGSWKPKIGQRFALSDANAAFAEMVQGRTSGKIVISVG